MKHAYTATAIALALLATSHHANAEQFWSSKIVPINETVNDTNPVELGLRVCFEKPGFVTAVRFYKGPQNSGPHTGSIWNANGDRLASVAFPTVLPKGWQDAELAEPLRISSADVGSEFVVSYFAPNGYYSGDNDWFTDRYVLTHGVTAFPNNARGPNGVYRYGATGGFPNQTYRASNYWVDLKYTPDSPISVWPNGAGILGACLRPAVLEDTDTAPVELGVRFTARTDGKIRGVRFYRGPGNTFPAQGYPVRIWTENGQELGAGSARISQNPASGWLTGPLNREVEVQAGQTYIASYHAPNGRYAVTENMFSNGFSIGSYVAAYPQGGVYRYGPSGSFPNEVYRDSNYWVDVVFVPNQL
jgi:Domain of unknown function (DUF4082)